MQDNLISQHKSLTELYADLCMRLRGIQKEMQAGNATCSWCGKRKAEHLHDGRCSVDALSQHFTNIRSDECERTQRALTLIEELRAL